MKKTVLYLGLDCPKDTEHHAYIHFPVIDIVPRNPHSPEIRNTIQTLDLFTHLIFTSKTTVNIFFDYLQIYGRTQVELAAKTIICVGQGTAKQLHQKGRTAQIIAHEETAEGIIKELHRLPLANALFLWPHSALSRNLLSDYFSEKQIQLHECIIYDTVPKKIHGFPPKQYFDEILFTSPSTVDAFLKNFGYFPLDKILKGIGPITNAYLQRIRLATLIENQALYPTIAKNADLGTQENPSP